MAGHRFANQKPGPSRLCRMVTSQANGTAVNPLKLRANIKKIIKARIRFSRILFAM
jgi:hypothetical protein